MSLSIEQAFQTLEIPSTATWEEVRQAYRELVKVWHPDRFQEDAKFQSRATKKIQDINAAYRILEQHFESPQPSPSVTPKPADEMSEQRVDDKQRQSQSASIPAGQAFPNFTSLEHLARYFSFNLPYHVYPCRIRRSNNTELTPDRLSRISINVLLAVILITVVLKLPPNLLFVCAVIAGALKVVELYGKHYEPPDALIFTELGVCMVEGISRKAGYYTATVGHTFLYEHLSGMKWNDEEISFVTINGLRFGFTPTSKEALTVPDTKWFKEGVFSATHVLARFKQGQP